MPDMQRDEPPPLRRRLRFSLVSLLLAMGLVGALVANYLNVRELQETKAALVKAHNELGELTIDDPKLVHVIGLLERDGLTHRSRVYLPKGKRFRICWASGGEIPQTTLPDVSQYDFAVIENHPDEPFLVSVSFYRDINQDFRLSWQHPSKGLTKYLDFERTDWLENMEFDQEFPTSLRTQSVPEGQPLILLRVRRQKEGPWGVFSPDSNATDGVVVWIEPY